MENDLELNFKIVIHRNGLEKLVKHFFDEHLGVKRIDANLIEVKAFLEKI